MDSNVYASGLMDSLPNFHSLGDANTVEYRTRCLPDSNLKDTLLGLGSFVPKKFKRKLQNGMTMPWKGFLGDLREV